MKSAKPLVNAPEHKEQSQDDECVFPLLQLGQLQLDVCLPVHAGQLQNALWHTSFLKLRDVVAT